MCSGQSRKINSHSERQTLNELTDARYEGVCVCALSSVQSWMAKLAQISRNVSCSSFVMSG